MNCSLCNTTCTSCDINANNCTACITGYALLNNTCYNPCPNGYYTNGGICSQCELSCTLCTTSSTNCQACVISGASKSYLLGSTCLATCPDPYYNSDNGGSGPTVCLLCDLACLSCYGTSTNCSSCAVNYFLYNFSCVNPCPTGFFGYKVTRTCVDVNSVSVTLSLQMYFSTSA